MTAPSRVFFRIIKEREPALADFRSNEAKGMQPPDSRPETFRVWSGISVYATAAQARRMARRYPGHGSYIAAVQIVDGGSIRVERTLSRPGHHTLWGRPEDLLACVVSVEPL